MMHDAANLSLVNCSLENNWAISYQNQCADPGPALLSLQTCDTRLQRDDCVPVAESAVRGMPCLAQIMRREGESMPPS